MSRTKPVTDQELAEAVANWEVQSGIIKSTTERLRKSFHVVSDIQSHRATAMVLNDLAENAIELSTLILSHSVLADDRVSLKRELREQTAGRDSTHV